ncbi:MAG TPA: FAD:protein FMN transferase [Kofleriaceae bacterium]|jgi:thiamine biosynthesis lipoprotein
MRRAAIAIALLGFAATADAKPAKIKYQDTVMGTYITVWFYTDREQAAADTAHEVFGEMHRLDGELSNFKPDSEIGKLNAAAGAHPVKVSDETMTILERSQDVSRRSGGVFDITIESFRGVWKFDEDMDQACKDELPACQLPSAADIEARRKLVNYHDLVLDPAKHTAFLRHKGQKVTLGGIAKGYSVDRCVDIVRKHGFTDFMVQAGGDMYVSGQTADDKTGLPRPWSVAIRDPRGEEGAMFAYAPIRDHSFSTSGDYERGFVKDGVRYHHIIDPRTGRPATASRSVTIRAHDAFTADAWSKVMFIYGWKAGLDIIAREKLDDFEVVWVDDKNAIHTTPGIVKDLKILHQPTPGP